MEKEVKYKGNTKLKNEVKYTDNSFKNLAVSKRKVRPQKGFISSNKLKDSRLRSKNAKDSTKKVESKEKMSNSQTVKKSSQILAESITEDINVLINIRLAQKNARRNKILTRPLKRHNSHGGEEG